MQPEDALPDEGSVLRASLLMGFQEGLGARGTEGTSNPIPLFLAV